VRPPQKPARKQNSSHGNWPAANETENQKLNGFAVMNAKTKSKPKMKMRMKRDETEN